MVNFERRLVAHRGYIESYRADLGGNFIDPLQVFEESKSAIKDILNTRTVLRIRILLCLSVLFVKKTGEKEIFNSFYFCSKCERILSSYLIDSVLISCFNKIANAIEVFVRNGSGWTIDQISFIDLHVGRYRDLRGGCRTMNLPKKLSNKKALLSINCDDNLCFLYSIAAKLYPQKFNKKRPGSYKKYIKFFKTKTLTFPLPLTQIPVFETLNKININLFGYEENEIFPMHISKKKNAKEVDLFFYDSHYFLIESFNRLLSSKNKCLHYCKNCLNGFKRHTTLINHIKLCMLGEPQKTSIPSNRTLKFSNMAKMLSHPFCIFADFECMTQKIQTATPPTSQSFIVPIEKHVPISYAMLATNAFDVPIYHEYYCGVDAINHFLQTLKKVVKTLIRKMHEIVPMDRNSRIFNKDYCHLCNKKFLPGEIKVKDHYHWGHGEITGLAHRSCNLNFRATYYIPVVIHNFQNYDSHLILRNLPPEYAKKIKIIPTNMQKFLAFSLDEIKFIDSFQFLEASLDTLVNNLNESDHDFKIFNTFFKNFPHHKHLLKRKGIFPYSYFDSLDVLDERKLPPKHAFTNLLSGEINDSDYQHALNVFNSFKCHTFSDYLELYQNCDTVMLAEVFSSFRRTSLKYYKLDPVHFVTCAELSWNAGLKYSKIELELLGNVTDYIWFESQMRGGICFLGTRYAKANNHLLPSTYNSEMPQNYILALDANNLYGHVMSMPLPIGNFACLTSDEISNFNILNMRGDSSVGYILEVDLFYPPSLHASHNDLPLAVEHLDITYDMLSPYSRELCDKFNLKSTLPCKKLVPNFYEKRNYITHYMNLKFYMEQGLELKKIHKILSFTQAPFLKDYIAFNNEKRLNSTNNFEKSFFKKLNNSFFGKSCQNCRKKIDLRGVFCEDECKKILSSPLLDFFEIINENFTVFKLKKSNLCLNKPIYMGFSVLELSKLHMYNLYYLNFKKTYGNKCNLLYMDTDSLYLSIETNDIFRDLKNKFSHILDTSNFPTNHIMYSEENRGKLGYLKHETTLPIKEFIGLKAKMYAFVYGDTCKKTAKGVKKSCLKKLTSDTYKNILDSKSFLREKQISIMNKKHELNTVMQNKIGLSAYYDKKFVMDDGIFSNSYGHFENQINDNLD